MDTQKHGIKEKLFSNKLLNSMDTYKHMESKRSFFRTAFFHITRKQRKAAD